MDDNDRWTKLAEEFRRLWDRRDPNFSAERGRYYEQLLTEYNSIAKVPVGLVTLKLKLAKFHKLKTGYIAKSVCMQCLKKSKDIAVLLPEFPCLWDPLNLNFTDAAVRAHCLEQLLEGYNRQNETRISMEELREKVNVFQINCCPGGSATISGSHTQAEIETVTQEENAKKQQKRKLNESDWYKLLEEFPCLWDPRDLNYRDETIRERSQRQLFARYNELSDEQISMTEVVQKLKILKERQRLQRQLEKEIKDAPKPVIRIEISTKQKKMPTERMEMPMEQREMQTERIEMPTEQRQMLTERMEMPTERMENSTERIVMPTEQIQMSTERMDNLTQRMEMPTERIDMSTEGTEMSAERIEMSTEGTEMSTERTKMSMEQMEKLVNDFPCLWDPENLHYNDFYKRARAREELLQKYNAVFRIPISMIELKRKLSKLNTRRLRKGIKKPMKRMEQLIEQFPCLWDPQDLNRDNVTLRKQARERLLEKYNAESSVQIDMEGLKRKIKNMYQQRHRKGIQCTSKASAERMERLMEEFPCLWDPQDLNRDDVTLKKRARERLLEKYNAESTDLIDMNELKRKIRNMFQRRHRGKDLKMKSAPNPGVGMDELVQQFPCLWDPEDLNFHDITIKARAREQLLVKYNAVSSIQIDMNKLKKKLKVASARRAKKGLNGTSKPEVQLVELMEESPCLWDPQDLNFNDVTLKARSKEQLLEKYNAVSSTPIDMEELERKLKSMQQPTTVTIQPAEGKNSVDLEQMTAEFPCLWDRQDLIYHDPTLKERTRKQLLEKYNAVSKIPIDMEELRKKLYAISKRGLKTKAVEYAKPSNRLKQLMEEFPCLWNPLDLNYTDLKIKERAREQLVQKYNAESSVPISIEDLKRILGNIANRRHRKGEKCTLKPSDRMKQLIDEFPCLWNRQDLNYNDFKMKARAREQLLQKYNAESSVPIGMEELKRKIANPSVRRYKKGEKCTLKASDRMKELIDEFPCLWNRQDLNYNDNKMKARAREQLLQKYNAESSVPIGMEELKRKLASPSVRRYKKGEKCTLKPSDRMKQLMDDFPCLWNRQDLNYNDNKMKARAREQLLQKCNAESSVPIGMEELKRKMDTRRIRRYGKGEKCALKPSDRMKQLMDEFPCLWNPQDLNYNDNKMKARAREQLLQKYNAESSVPIGMEELKRKMGTRRIRRYMNVTKGVQKASERMEELVNEYPCLWNIHDLNFSDITMKVRARQQLLQKYNAVSTVPINMMQLKNKLRAMSKRLRGKGIKGELQPVSRLAELSEEFPCLWDPQDPCYRSKNVKQRAQMQLLEKYNAVSSVPINMWQLKRKLGAMNSRRARMSKMRRLESVEQTTPTGGTGSSIQSSDLIASLHAINSQSLLHSNDSRFSLDSSEPLTPGSSEEDKEAEDEPLEPTHQTPQCRVCGVLDENCINITNDTPYVAENTTTLTLNNLHLSLDYTTKTVCQNCDTKLKEIYNFVTLVKSAQDNMKIDASDIKTEVTEECLSFVCDDSDVYATEIDSDEVDLKDLDLDSISVTDTEFVKQTVSAYLGETKEEIPKPRKRRRVYVDLSSCSLTFRNEDDNKDNINLIPETSQAETEDDLKKETVFADKNTGVIIEVLKRVTKTGGNSGGVINNPIDAADYNDHVPRKKAKKKNIGADMPKFI